MPNLQLFEPGVEITNLVIVEAVMVTGVQHSTRYLVQYGCCGKQGTLSHSRIKERISDNSTRCKACNRKTSGRRQTRQIVPPLEPGFHGWDPPPSAIKRRLAEQ